MTGDLLYLLNEGSFLRNGHMGKHIEARDGERQTEGYRETNGERNTEALMAPVSKDHFLRNSQLCEQFNFFVGSNSL